MPCVHRIGDDNMQGRERKRRSEWREQHRARYEQIAARLANIRVVDTFKVWRDGERLIIVDGRHFEYSAARRLGLPIQTVEVPLESREHAQSYMISEVLLDKGRPSHNAYWRIQLAANCRYIVQYAEIAKCNRGRRTDLLAQAPKTQPRNTRKVIADLAGVGEKLVGMALQLGKLGPIYFDQQRWQDIQNALIVGDMDLRSAFRKLKGEIEFAKAEVEEELKRGKDFSTATDEDDLEEGEEETGEETETPSKRRKEALSGAVQHARGLVKSSKALATRKADNIAKRIAKFPFINPNLDEIDWHKANRIICGDNSEVMAKVPSGIATLVFGSPPYPVPKQYAGGDDYAKPLEEWLEKDIAPVVIEAARVLREGGRLILNVADCFELKDKKHKKRSSLHLPIFAKLVHFVEAMDLGFLYREVKLWLKFIFPQRAPLGSHGSPSDPKSFNNHEWLIVWSLKSHKLNPPYEGCPSGMTNDFYRQKSVGEWCIAPVSNNKGDHPCPFPQTLAENVIRLYSYPTDLVIDPWVGSGTTAAVAAKLGRRWIGIDRDDAYCRNANARVHEEENKRKRKLAKTVELKGEIEELTLISGANLTANRGQ